MGESNREEEERGGKWKEEMWVEATIVKGHLKSSMEI